MVLLQASHSGFASWNLSVLSPSVKKMENFLLLTKAFFWILCCLLLVTPKQSWETFCFYFSGPEPYFHLFHFPLGRFRTYLSSYPQNILSRGLLDSLSREFPGYSWKSSLVSELSLHVFYLWLWKADLYPTIRFNCMDILGFLPLLSHVFFSLSIFLKF